jgi:hypothetical protein
MAPKTTAFSDAETEILLNFVNANKIILLDPIEKTRNGPNLQLRYLRQELFVQCFPPLKNGMDAKREWDQAYVTKPTDGDKIRELAGKLNSSLKVLD